jgi:acetate kinase
MNVFVLNAGSSSFKAAYFDGAGGGTFGAQPNWYGEVRWSATAAGAKLDWTSASANGTTGVDVSDHGTGASALLRAAMETFGIAPDFIGHRIVHGMSESRCTIIDARVRNLIEKAVELAPLHNRAALAGIDAAHAAFPAAPQAADFDTAFHTTLAPEVAAYALPYDWYARRGIRRYGFHGISHRYCAGRTAELLEREPAGLRMVSAHLGNGCSLAAIVDGKSVDTTMGYTPLDGLMMGTRSGTVDPGLLLYLLRSGQYSVAELDTVLNSGSGLKGVSERSEDVRDVIAAAAAGDVKAQLALDMYVHRLASAVAALSFTGGVGEHSAYVRERVCARLAFLGVALDRVANDGSGDREVGAPGSNVRISVVTAREEYAIARDVALLGARDARPRFAR